MSATNVHRPGHLSGALVAIAVWVLPTPCRDRYSDEIRADLSILTRGRGLPYALGTLGGAVRLRRAIVATDTTRAARSVIYWKCRLGRHKWSVVNDENPEQRKNTHRECSRCLKIKDSTEFEHDKTTWISMGPGF